MLNPFQHHAINTKQIKQGYIEIVKMYFQKINLVSLTDY